LAGAYFIMAGVNMVSFFIGSNESHPFIIRYSTLIISSFQSFLFTSALITLISMEFLTKRRVLKELIPILTLTVFCFFGLLSNLPSDVLYAIFYVGTAYYIFQLIHYTRLFRHQFSSYQEKLDNYFSEREAAQLEWIQFSFYFALSVGIIALTSIFVTSIVVSMFFIVIYGFFYLYFGIKYLNYIYVFNTIEPVTHSDPEGKNELLRLGNEEVGEAVERWVQNKGFLKTGVTLIDLAAQLNTNRTYLSNYINQQKGMNFNSWVNWLRIEEGKLLLINSPQLSIAFVSEQLGYTEQSNFGRYFLKYTGTTPRQWRQEHSK